MRRAALLVLSSATGLAALGLAASSSAEASPAAAPAAHPQAAQPHLDTADEHSREDAVVHDAADEAALAARTASAVRRTTTSALSRAAAAGPQVTGQWGPLTPWPVVGVHVALLPDGKVLAYDSVGDHATESYPVHDHTRATVWDPATGTHTPVDLMDGFNVFCSGLAHLADGRVFVAGGNRDSALNGIVQTHVFNISTGTWTRTADMAYARWYPSVTPLPNKELLITEGGPDVPEVRATNGTIRTLPGAALDLPLYPWLDVAPDGRPFYSGPDSRMLKLSTSGTGSWQSYGAGDGDRSYGSHAVYDIGKVLVAGGGPSRADAAVIDLNGATPVRTPTAPMATGRRQHNVTVLADGTVLATGGNSSGASLVDLAAGVYPAERWDPATGTWTTLAPMAQTRQYHSTALLLPDGRVLSSGGGICGTCDAVGYLAKDAQVFSPPYLFDATGAPATRPVVTSAPGTVAYGTPFAVTTPSAASIRKVALVRLGAVTHSTEMEQRYVPLSFTASGTTLTVTGPKDAAVAPPGVYMLFVLNAQGVPSVAKTVRVDAATLNAAPTVALTSPRSGATLPRTTALTLAATAADRDGTVRKVEFFRADGTVKLGEDTTAPYTWTWRYPGTGTKTLRARATDDRGAVTTSARVTVTIAS